MTPLASDYLIPFNKPYLSGREFDYMNQAVQLGKLSGNGEFTHRCQNFFSQRYGFRKCLLTTSCTDALEMAAILLDIQPGDEVILPSFTFVSTANAFVSRGAKPVFVDSKPDHPNMDVSQIEALITAKTKAIVVMHYGGVPCELEAILSLAQDHGLYVVEDAAQSIDAYYQDKPLGAFGHLACFSFHETKNIHAGEGGMLVINDPQFVQRAEVIWEKGTDRRAFSRGEVQKYSWVDIGSSFLPSELTAAFLYAQLENLDVIQSQRRAIGTAYERLFQSGKSDLFSSFYDQLLVQAWEKSCPNLPIQTQTLAGNHHLFYLLFLSEKSRSTFISTLKEHGVLAVFHYQSLHRSPFIHKNFPDQAALARPSADRFSNCLLRLPLFFELPEFSHRVRK